MFSKHFQLFTIFIGKIAVGIFKIVGRKIKGYEQNGSKTWRLRSKHPLPVS